MSKFKVGDDVEYIGINNPSVPTHSKGVVVDIERYQPYRRGMVVVKFKRIRDPAYIIPLDLKIADLKKKLMVYRKEGLE